MPTPFGAHLQKTYDKATHRQWKYLWGVVYAKIADYTGHTSQEVHEYFMQTFGMEYVILPNEEWEFRRKKGSDFTKVDISVYMEKVCAYVMLEFNLYIEPPL